eukprot:COSAG02_NODE_36584_length_453_cov_0.584746_1_plen_89_part_10
MSVQTRQEIRALVVETLGQNSPHDLRHMTTHTHTHTHTRNREEEENREKHLQLPTPPTKGMKIRGLPGMLAPRYLYVVTHFYFVIYIFF